jgi:anaerobic magnesium-protoporphyrin IX monomethyl ester cyclase
VRVLFIKYHEAADQQPLSRRAAEKLGIFPSLPLASLASWIRQHGFDVRILDLHVKNITPQDAAREVAEYDPQVVAITVKTLGWPACIEIAEMVRATVPRAVIVIGGPHLGIYPRESLSWPCFDVAVVGDGEETFLELCERVRDGGIEPATIAELDRTAGTIIRHPDGELV